MQSQAAKGLAGIGVVAATIGGYLALGSLCFDSPGCNPAEDHTKAEVGVPLLLGGLAMALAGFVMGGGDTGGRSTDAELAAASAKQDQDRAAAAIAEAAALHEREAAALLERKRRARASAWAAFAAADAAAREEHCEVVRTLDSQVAALDADFHATVFIRSAAIARCLPSTTTEDTDAHPP